VRVEDGGGSVIAEYYYDPFGKRLWKNVSGSKTYFIYADEGLVGEVDENGIETRSYGYKPSSIWSTDPLFMKHSGTYYFYHNDQLGTPQKITSANGAVVWAAKYETFGKSSIDSSSTVTNNLRFPGQYYDQETGLNYNYQRYYDPETGRYFSIDPIGIKSEGSNHLYLYCLNNPLTLIDPKGEEQDCTSNFACHVCIIYGEAAGTSDICLKAVAWVIRNRVYDPGEFPGDECSVVKHRNGREFNAYGKRLWNKCCNDCLSKSGKQVKKSIEDLVDKLDLGTDITDNSTFFHDKSMDTPSWIKKKIKAGLMKEVKVPGCISFRFYKKIVKKPIYAPLDW
jgi:RHS repeat-associated protein